MQKKYAFSALAGLCLTVTLVAASLAQAAAPVDFRDLVKASIPAVVNINSERTEEVRSVNPFDMFRGHPDMERFFSPFQDFYDRGAPRSRKSTSLGSGFIISSDGYIVTNNHVIEGADVVRVNISGNNKKEDSYTAEVIGTDPETDLALLKIKADNLPFLRFGDSNVLEVGEWVVAIGSPLGLDHTVTAGIVSAKGRNIQSGSYDDFLQTDASINRGNSGGPLLNMNGDVVGINTAIAQRAQGIGFAIPSSLAQRIISDLRDHKKVSRGWLGVTIQNVDSAMAKALGLANNKGALVNSVLEGQPAALAGIREGDVIIKIDDQSIEDTEQLLRVVALLSPGSKAAVTVIRDGKEERLSLTVAERDLNQASGKDDTKGGGAQDATLGLQVRPISPEDVRRYGLNSNAGLLIVSVKPDSLAARTGLQPGDVILAVNRHPVATEKDLAAKIKESAKQRGAALLQISRQGNVFFRAVELEK